MAGRYSALLRKQMTEASKKATVRDWRSPSGKDAVGLMMQLAQSAKARSKKKGVECSITGDDLIQLLDQQGFRSAISGRPFTFIQYRDRENGAPTRSPLNPSIDRFPDIGGPYKLENIRLITVHENIAISDFGEDVFADMAEVYLNYRRANGSWPVTLKNTDHEEAEKTNKEICGTMNKLKLDKVV